MISTPAMRGTMTSEVLQYEPTDDDIGDTANQYICGNSPLTEADCLSVGSMAEHILKVPPAVAIRMLFGPHPSPEHEVPPYLESQKELMFRYLVAAGGNVPNACKMMVTSYTNSREIVHDTEVLDELRDGLVYWYGRDTSCRPILYINLVRLKRLENDPTRVGKLIVFCLDFMLRVLIVAGRVETCTAVVDAAGMKITNAPFGLLRVIINVLADRYRGRLHRLHLINCPYFVSFLSKVILPMAPESARKKIYFSKTGEDFRRVSPVHDSQCPAKYGGTGEEPEVYYPFVFPPGRVTSVEGEVEEEEEEEDVPLETMTKRLTEGYLWIQYPGVSLEEMEWVKELDNQSITYRASCHASEILDRPITPSTANTTPSPHTSPRSRLNSEEPLVCAPVGFKRSHWLKPPPESFYSWMFGRCM